jgi:hypothetical protein
MVENQYAVAKARMLSGESNLKGSNAFKTVLLESQPRVRPNLAKLVRAWIKANDIEPLFPGDPCHLVYFKVGHIRLAILSDSGVFRVALESEYNRLEMILVKEWLSNTAGDSELDQPRDTGSEGKD